LGQDVHPREVDRDPVFPSRKLSREFRIGVFVFVDQYRGDKAPQHERREQGRHPVESKESARIVVYIYIFNREREREIVRRRQSSIVSIIFSFFEIILFSLPLSLFLFVVVARASEAFKKKKKSLLCEKKSSEKLSAFSSCFVTNFTSDHPPKFNYWNEDGGESVASKRRTRFFLLKNDERNVHLSFSDGFLERNPRKDEKDARAREK
jgi:hypothetical protein